MSTMINSLHIPPRLRHLLAALLIFFSGGCSLTGLNCLPVDVAASPASIHGPQSSPSLSVSPAPDQPPDLTGQVLDLAQCITIALKQNPETRASWQAARAAAAERAKSSYLPSADFTGVAVRGDSVNLDSPLDTGAADIYEAKLGLRYLLFNGGARAAGLTKAEAELLSADFQHNATLEKVILRVEEAYYRLLAAKEFERVAEQTIRQTQYHVDVARVRYWPEVTLNTDYGQRDRTFFPDRDEWSFGLGITWPLFDGFNREYGIRQAKSNLARTIAEHEKALRGVELEVWTAYSQLIEAAQATEAARALVTSADESARVAEGEYKNGAASIIEVTDAQTARTAANMQLVQARLDWYTARARISGKVEHLYANIGDVVKKGEIVAKLESNDLAATVEQRQAELQVAEAKLSAVMTLDPKEIEKAEAEIDQWQATKILAEKQLHRQEELAKEDFTSEQSQDQARERLAVAKARLASALKALDLAKTRYKEDKKQADADIKRARAVLANAGVKLSYATITAPISGVIASVSTQQGETVSAGLNVPTFVTIIDLNRIQVDAFVDETDIGKVKVGQKAMFTVDTYPNREFTGRVAAIYPKAVIQDNVINYDVVININTPFKGLLRPDMTASVTIYQEERQGVLMVPRKAVIREGGRKFILVQSSDGSQQRKAVTTGTSDGNRIEIVSGLNAGDTVVIESR